MIRHYAKVYANKPIEPDEAMSAEPIGRRLVAAPVIRQVRHATVVPRMLGTAANVVALYRRQLAAARARRCAALCARYRCCRLSRARGFHRRQNILLHERVSPPRRSSSLMSMMTTRLPARYSDDAALRALHATSCRDDKRRFMRTRLSQRAGEEVMPPANARCRAAFPIGLMPV